MLQRGWRETLQSLGAGPQAVHVRAHEPANVAAPTTSPPEVPNGARNWDYRYTGCATAAFTLYALLRPGFSEEVKCPHELAQGAIRRSGQQSGPLQIMYGIDGARPTCPKREALHLEGYMGSAPVRIGNGAATQLQLDIYGQLMDSVYLCNKGGRTSTTTAGSRSPATSSG